MLKIVNDSSDSNFSQKLQFCNKVITYILVRLKSYFTLNQFNNSDIDIYHYLYFSINRKLN